MDFDGQKWQSITLKGMGNQNNLIYIFFFKFLYTFDKHHEKELL